MRLEPTTPEDVGERVTIPVRWIFGYFALAVVAELVILNGNWCNRPSRPGLTAAWFLIGVILSAFITSPAIAAALLINDTIRRSYRGSWLGLRPRLKGAVLAVLVTSAGIVAGGTWLLVQRFSLQSAVLIGGVTIVVSLLLGAWAANHYPRGASEEGRGEYTARMAVVAIGIVGIVGALMPSVAARINNCRYPEGYGGIIASLAIVPAMIVSVLTWAAVEMLSKWRGPIAR